MRFSGAALTDGVEEHLIDGVPVHITSVAKTVADCFKYRNKIGLDVALEALREAWHGKRMTSDDLWAMAKVSRVANVMRPYLEAIAWLNNGVRRQRHDCFTRRRQKAKPGDCVIRN